MRLKKGYLMYKCKFAGQKVGNQETGIIGEEEVLQKIFNEDYLYHNLDLINPATGTHYPHEWLKVPSKDGLFLFKVINPSNRSCVEVLIDARSSLNFVLVEDKTLKPKESCEVAKIMAHSIILAAEKYKWDAKVARNRSGKIHHMKEFEEAMEYADNIDHSDYKPNLIFNQPQVSQLVVDNHGSISNI